MRFRNFFVLVVVVCAMFLFACSKSGSVSGASKKGAVHMTDLYKESIQASLSYAKGAPSYKPANAAISISAEKGSGDHSYNPNNENDTSSDVLTIHASGPASDGATILLDTKIPVSWLKNQGKLSALDKEFDALTACAEKVASREAQNPLLGENPCNIGSLTYNGHPGETLSDNKNAPHLQFMVYNSDEKVASGGDQ